MQPHFRLLRAGFWTLGAKEMPRRIKCRDTDGLFRAERSLSVGCRDRLAEWEKLARFHLAHDVLQRDSAKIAAVLPHPSRVPEDEVGVFLNGGRLEMGAGGNHGGAFVP